MVDLESRRLLCACRGCATLVARPDGARYRTVPRQAHRLRDFCLTDAEWDAFGIPIDMAFLFHSTPDGRPVALYPGPAGATESALSLDGWSRLMANNPALADLQPDVEALLVNRTNGCRDYYRMPIDRCYQLVGLIRTHWRGLSGGADVWDNIRDYFAQLQTINPTPGERGP